MTIRSFSVIVLVSVFFLSMGACKTASPQPASQLEEEAGSSREDSLQAQHPLEPEQVASTTTAAQTEQKAHRVETAVAHDPVIAVAEQQETHNPVVAEQTEHEAHDLVVAAVEQQEAHDPVVAEQTEHEAHDLVVAAVEQQEAHDPVVAAAEQTEQEQRIEAQAAAVKNSFVVNDAAALAQAITAINSDSTDRTYTLTITNSFVSEPLVFTDNAAKTIIIQGDRIPRSILNNSGVLVSVPKGITLVLDNNITLNGNNKAFAIVSVAEGGTLLMKNGSMVRGAQETGVFVDGGTFTMKGGEIVGNTKKSSRGTAAGGGVHIKNGTFTISGGEISDNTLSASSSYGGGVYIESSTVTMTGGSISGNTSSDSSSYYSYGAGVAVYKESNFIMEGGSINGNTSSFYGAGVYVDTGTSFTMTDGEIRGNKAGSAGGGVYVNGTGIFTKIGGGTLDDTNTAKEGKVVYISIDRSTFKQRTSTADPSVRLDSLRNGQAGGWE
ncbi:MAG: hypothetical protein LBO67_07045 [Spirochaetaceae bacterium]|jgi:hypothetical protein|nr:hypothetical protein [Spirochaetaceae bacterium]